MCKMATVRRLVVSEQIVPRIRVAGRSSYHIHIPNRHYWSARSCAPYARAHIYNKDAYYSRWIQQRDIRNARLCGSWTRRRARDYIASKEASRKLESETEKSSRGHDRQKDNISAEELYKHFRDDTASAYSYYKRMIEKDPYRWLFDPYNHKRAWNPIEWLEKNQEIFEKRRSQVKNSKSEPSFHGDSKHSQSNTTAEHKTVPEEYMIDPITLRKVPVPKSESEETGATLPEQSYTKTSVTHDIPIKRYNSIKDKASEHPIDDVKTDQPQGESSNNAGETMSSEKKTGPKLLGFASQPWLVKEGFTTSQTAPSTNATSLKSSNTVKSERIEPSLNRVNKTRMDPRPSLQYPPPEKTTDDVDLLCASNIRAASGHTKTKDQPSSAETDARSKVLRTSWRDAEKRYSQDLHKTYNEILEKREARAKSQAQETITSEAQKPSDVQFKEVKKHYDELQHELNQTRKMLEQARTQFLHDRLASETSAVKESFNSFESRPRKQILTVNSGKSSTNSLPDIKRDVENAEKLNKVERSKRDADLVAQIRNIYEQSYGTITTNHRQGGSGEEIHRGSPETMTKPLPDTRSTLIGSQISGNIPAQFPEALDSQIGVSKHIGSAPIRELLYRSISEMPISEAAQKRLKFALRGIPELDEVVSKSDSVQSTESTPTQIAILEALNDLRKTQASLIEERQKIQNAHAVAKDKPKDQGSEKEINNSHPKRAEENTYIYKILAYDIASGEVAVATTTSSIKHKSSIPRSAAGILVHLDQAPKYFSHIEKLDAEGYKLVSGSRTMLVYRCDFNQDNGKIEPAFKRSISSTGSTSLKPLREEPVFSGPLKPKERLLRSYQLAHRRARSNSKNNDLVGDTKSSTESQKNDSQTNEDRSLRSKLYRGFTSRTGTVILAVLLCYAVGVAQSINSRKELEEGARKRREEAVMRRLEAQKNEWKWF